MRDNNNRGYLTPNDKKVAGSRQPDYTGTLAANGIEFSLSAWDCVSEDGGKYISISPELRASQRLSPYALRKAERDRLGGPSAPTPPSPPPQDSPKTADDDLPF